MFKKVLSIFLVTFFLIQCELPDPLDDTPPVVQITSPEQNAVITENFTLIIEANDNDKIKRVWANIAGERSADISSRPYEIAVDISDINDGLAHSIVAFAEDDAGNVAFTERSVIVGEAPDVTPPSILLLYPINNTQVSGTINIIADIYDNVGVISAEFFIDGILENTDIIAADGWSTSWDASSAGSGSHSIYIKAYDAQNNVGTSSLINVTVMSTVDNIPPEILITYPINNSTVSGIINVAADISDNVAVTRAEFFIDGILEDTDTNGTNGWSTSWDANSAGSGTHSFYVKAYDAQNNVGTSTLITVTVL